MNISNKEPNYHLHLNHLDLNFVSKIKPLSCHHGSLLETKEPADYKIDTESHSTT